MAENVIGTGVVLVKPNLDESAVSAVNAKGAAAGSGFGSAFSVAAGNLIANAVTAIASAAVQVFSDAFSNYANFEQLSGGVEKIFDQANIDQIMADANQAYKELNMSANDYLAAINQTGAAFAQTMGDQKGYDTARKGMMAIADYASGTGRNLDELNQKYALITRSTASYQSIADQFSGILPATSADFLAQAQAAGYLSDEYTKLTEVPIDEYQAAVTAMLEKGVDDMGLAGNTLAETTNTISGSLAGLSSAWQNYLTGIFDENADMGMLGEQLMESVGNVINVVAPKVQGAIMRALEAIPGAISGFLSNVPSIIGPVIESVFGEELGGEINAVIAESWGEISSTFSGALSTITSLMQTAWPIIQSTVENAMTVIGSIVETVWPAISTIIEDYAGTAVETIEQAMGVIQGVMEQAWPVIQQIVDIAMSAIDAIMTNVWPHLSSLITTVQQTVLKVIQAAWPFIMNVISTAMTAIQAITQAVWPAVSGIVQGAMSAIEAAINAIGPIVGFVTGVFDGILNAIKDPMETAKNIVQTAIDFIEGIFSGAHLELPHINLPHFNIYGGEAPWGIGGVGSPPTIDIEWYARGGIVDGPSLIGAGESGPEAIVPLTEPNIAPFADAVAQRMGSGITVNNMTVVTPDPEDFMRQLTAFASRTRAQYA